MLKKKIESIQDPHLKAFTWRVYNTFVAVVLPLILPLVLIEMQRALEETGDLSPLADGAFWYGVLFLVTTALIGSAIAGLNKIRRMP